jgi:hypothetical protein
MICTGVGIISCMESSFPDHPSAPLDYARPGLGKMVLMARFGTADEAQLHAAELEAAGIRTRVLNANVNALGIPYTGLSEVELHVLATDAQRAAKVLNHADDDDLEPDPDGGEGGLAEPAIDESGQPITVVPVASFETVRRLRDAQTVLASARLPSYLPKLLPRGDGPPGTGKRFILRIAPEDLERAQFILEQSDRDAKEELPRCPQCASWRVYPVSHFLKSLAATLGLAPKPQPELECLSCHHRAPATDFAPNP